LSAVSIFFVLTLITPFIIKYSRSVYLPTKVLLLGAFVCIAHVHVAVGNAEGLGPVLWYLVIILSATFILGMGWGLFYTIFSIGLMAFFNISDYLEWGIMGDTILTGAKRLAMFPFRIVLPFSFLLMVAKEFIKSQNSAEQFSENLLKEQKVLAQQLSKSEKDYRELIEEVTDMIFKVDRNGKLFYVNPEFLETMGYDKQELIGENANKLIHKEDIAAVKKKIKAQINSQQVSSYMQFRVLTKSGKTIWIGQNTKMIFNKTGKRIQSFCVARNVSKQKELYRLREKAKVEAERQNEMKNHFMAAVSHELRTPLNAVIALGHNLLAREDRPEPKEDLQNILFSAENLLSIIKDITSISLMESGQAKVHTQPFDLANTLKKFLKIQQQLNQNEKVAIELDWDEQIPTHVMGDEVRLLQILNNLVNNAVKFTEDGTVKMIAQVKEITTQKTRLYFEVRDTGIGIEQNQIDNIFKRFTQANASLSRSHGGIGVGLTVVKQVLNLLDSQIQVKSEVGKGSSFSFVLSFMRPKQPTKISSELISLPKDLLKGTKVLLVEDNKMNQLVAMKFLKKWQTQIDVAGNGKIAVEKFQQQSYDIILMDLEMPIMNGIDATKAIRMLPKGKKLPILAVTASVANNIVDSILSNQFTDIVTKPYKPDYLYQKMVEHLQKQVQIHPA